MDEKKRLIQRKKPVEKPNRKVISLEDRPEYWYPKALVAAEKKMPFGMYSRPTRRKLMQIPYQYICWLHCQDWFPEQYPKIYPHIEAIYMAYRFKFAHKIWMETNIYPIDVLESMFSGKKEKKDEKRDRGK